MFRQLDGRRVVEDLDEFDDAREVVAALSAEYEACEHPDYIERGVTGLGDGPSSPSPVPRASVTG